MLGAGPRLDEERATNRLVGAWGETGPKLEAD